MDTEALDKIKLLRRDANALRSFREKMRELASNPNCDKRGFGFSQDSRFRAFKLSTGFDSWYGYYGNSGCSTVLHIADDSAVAQAFVKAMNQHQDLLFEAAASFLLEEASTLDEKAEAELSELRNLLNEARGGPR